MPLPSHRHAVLSRRWVGVLAVSALTLAGAVAAAAPASAAGSPPTALNASASTDQLWGVDTSEAITTSNIASVKSQAGAVPQV